MTPRRPFTLTRGELAAIISRLDRSRAGGAATGSFLENLSKLLQVLAIVGGGAWVLLDYFEFKKTNNELTNKQLELALKTAELSQSSTMLNNQLNQLKLTPTGAMTIHTPSTGAAGHQVNQYDVSLLIPHQMLTRQFHALAVGECSLRTTQGIDGLLGRDILEHCLFIYSGPDKAYILSI